MNRVELHASSMRPSSYRSSYRCSVRDTHTGHRHAQATTMRTTERRYALSLLRCVPESGKKIPILCILLCTQAYRLLTAGTERRTRGHDSRRMTHLSLFDFSLARAPTAVHVHLQPLPRLTNLPAKDIHTGSEPSTNTFSVRLQP